MLVNDKIDRLNVAARRESIEVKVTGLVEEKIHETMRKTHEIVEESFDSVVNKVEDNKKWTISQPPKVCNISLSHKNEMSFRVQGIPEDPDKTCDQNYVTTLEHVIHILKTIGVKVEIVNLRRPGKFPEGTTQTACCSRHFA